VNTLPPPSVRDQAEARRRAEQMVQDVNRIETRQASEAAERRRRVEMEQAAEAEQQRRAQREAQRQAAQEESQRLLVIRPGPLVPHHPHPAPPPPRPAKPVDETRSAQMRGYPPIR
jgi:multidrug efflux pump subunit AcrA (membrane-fusion protein)